MIHADEISKSVQAYLHRHPDEAGGLTALTEALARTGDPTSRKTFPGHVTCSAIIIDPIGQVLHIHHNFLKTWLRPGGHLEADDTSLVGAALREVAEETGIAADQLMLADDVPVDIDIHTIPANPAKGEPEHQHFDLRWAFTITSRPAVALQTEEVHDFAWLPAAELQPAILRDKIAAIRSPAAE